MPKSYLTAISFLLAAAAVCSAQVTFTEYPVPTGSSGPGNTSGPAHIVTGSDGALWFTEAYGNKIGRITAAGAFTEYSVPTGSPGLGNTSGPNEIAAGLDGNLWFAEFNGNKIGRITTAGVITEFPVPTSGACCPQNAGSSGPDGITAGPDGNLWFTEYHGNKIGRITTAGVITEFPIPTIGSFPPGITAGSDGNLWFTEADANQIGRINPNTGVITEFPIPTGSSSPIGITAGQDGNLWFAEASANQIGRITTAGAFTEYSVPTSNSGPNFIAKGPDGNLWFTEANANQIGRITTAGAFTEYSVPTVSSEPAGIALGPDGNMWFTEYLGNKIGKAILTVPITITSAAATPNSLWPPNHKLVPVSVSATTSGGSGAVSCKIASVSSNEPVDADGDWIITGNLTLTLRAERNGLGTGRIYTIAVQCTDGSGNGPTTTVNVTVPHDQGH